MELKIKVKKTKRIYNVLKDNNISETIINRLRQNKNNVLVNNIPSRVVDTIKRGSELVIKIDDKQTNKIQKTFNKINIVFEDDYLLAINKPPFISSIPNNYKTSIASDVLGYLNIGTYMPINRLDVNTSGIMLIAKTPLIQHLLTNNFKKTYIALLNGKLKKHKVVVNKKIGLHHTQKSIRLINGLNAKECTTIFKKVKTFKNVTLAKIKLITGRTHQIRVHSQFINCPILGDEVYGLPSLIISRQALHAYKVKFKHPITKKSIVIKTPIPNDFLEAIKKLH